MNWLRWHHGTTKDAKWKVISIKTGVPIIAVLAIWATMLESASESEVRGELSGWEPDEIAVTLDIPIEQVIAVFQAMQGKVLDDTRLISWEKRNPKREREDNSTERVQKHRDGVKHHVTPCNAMKHPEERRVEEKRKEESKEAPPAFRVSEADFQDLWRQYPNPVKRKDAWRHFRGDIRTTEELKSIGLALEHYKTRRLHENARRKERGSDEIPWQNGSTWFNNWRDWIPEDFEQPDDRHSHRCQYCEPLHEWDCGEAETCNLSRDLACPKFAVKYARTI